MSLDLKQDIERVKLVLAQHEGLSKQESVRCYQTIFKHARGLAPLDDFVSMIADFILCSNDSLICEDLLMDVTFWSTFKDVVEDMEPEAFSQCLKKLFSSVLDQHRIVEKAVDSICEHILSDNVILGTIALNLASKSLEGELNVRFFDSVSQLQHCLVIIAKSNPPKAATYIPLYKLISLECKLFYVMTPHLSQDKIRTEMIEVFLPVRKQLYEYLETVSIDDYSTPLKERFINAMNNAINLNVTSKSTFEEANEEHKDLSKLNMLQALDITAFLENPNLSFKKTFTEQLIFGNKPFPLYKGSSHVSLCLNNLFDTFEGEINEKPYLAGFILNKNLFMYALMDRLLKSWVESKAETDTDINSLLQLIPIILEKTRSSTSNKNDLSHESLVSLALDVIKSLDYHVTRELQLDGLRKGYYMKWAKHLSDFEVMLSDQVKDYVLHQRLLQLQKGTWVYAQNPVDPSTKSLTAYFMILSADQASLAVKEFPRITEEIPSLEGKVIISSAGKTQGNDGSRTLVIPLNSIERFESRDVAITDNTPKDSHLISCIQKNTYTEMRFLDRNSRCLLRVYFDNKETLYIWLDGLQLVSSAKHGKGISSATKEQIETLVDIRRNVQMINLNIRDTFEAPETSSSDEEYYNVETLKGLTTGFHYE